MSIVQMLFSFEGRLRRRDFWLCTLGLVVFCWLVESVAGAMFLPHWMAIGGPSDVRSFNPAAMGGFWAVYCVVFLLALWPSLAIAIKRCHDRNQTGVWVLMMLIPVIGFFWWLINLGILDGTPGPNQYGPSPKGSSGPIQAAA
jgi:uncharacterized membrane protein YhaH (DUF805 family)